MSKLTECAQWHENQAALLKQMRKAERDRYTIVEPMTPQLNADIAMHEEFAKACRELSNEPQAADWHRIESVHAEIGDEFQLGGQMAEVSGLAINHLEWLPIKDEQQKNGVRYFLLPCRTRRNPTNAALTRAGENPK